MNSEYKKQFQSIKKHLGIESIISIRFSNTKTVNFNKYKDTACTALARSLKNNILTYIDRKSGQLCPGGNYFLGISKLSKQEVCDVYVKDERVFKHHNACFSFLDEMPKYPMQADKRYVLFTPLEKEKNKPEVVVMLATPAQASRVLGLSAFKKMRQLSVLPAISTCVSIYAPLISRQIHLNFIDYYDRYYQGRQGRKLIWKDKEMLISLPYSLFFDIIKHIPFSAHGSYKVKLNPQKITKL